MFKPKHPIQLSGIIVLFFLSFFVTATIAQIDSSEVNTSPYGVIYNHLYYLQEDSYDPERAALSLPTSIPNRRNLAIQLKRILDSRGMYVDIHRLPKDSTFIDSLSQDAIYYIDKKEPRIYVERQNGQWYYSRTTINLIPVLFKEIFPLGTEFMQYFHGPFWDFKLIGLSVAKWFGLLLLFILSFLVYFFTNWVAGKFISKFLQRQIGILPELQKDIKKIARIFGLFMVTRILLYFLPMFQLPIRLNALVLKSLGVFSIFFLILLLNATVSIVFHYLDLITKKTENTLDDQLLPVLRRIVSIIIWSIGILYIFDYLGVNITALLAGISIGGLAIALAAQDTVKNFFGSIMIFLDRPFQIGDWINFDDVDGTVEEVGVRSTRIRTFANSVVYVPNGMLADKVVNNMGLRKYRRFKTELGVTYNTSPDKIELFITGIREIIKKHPTTRKDYFEVHLNSFGASSINILLYCFFEAPDWTAELKGKHEIMYAILLLADELGISFAFPSQSIYVEAMPAQATSKPNTSGTQQLNASLEKIDKYFKSEKHSDLDKIKPIGGE